MSRITKIVVAVLATVLVAAGAIVVYRETDLLTGSLVVLAALMIVGLLVRRVAVREEKAGMAEWEREAMASAAAAEDLFGDWKVSSPRTDGTVNPPPTPMSPSPTVAPPVPGLASFPAPPLPAAPPPVDEVPESADPTVTMSRPIRTPDDRADDGPAVGTEHAPDHPDDAAPDHLVGVEARTPAYAGAAASATEGSARMLIDWSGQGRPVNEQVRSSDDIMKASDATALPTAAVDPTAGGELARLLAKVEARLRDYD
ncbi:MAG TPA: hypothetical protein VIY72_06970 [Acidimicrobiales bacterium]